MRVITGIHTAVNALRETSRKAYRITIHESYRENGKVKKRQIGICTVDYYDLATDWFCLYDWGGSKIEAATKELNCSEEEIYTLIEKKVRANTRADYRGV